MNTEYSGHRILEAMRSAPRYTDAVYKIALAAMGNAEGQIVEFGAGDGVFVDRFRNNVRAVLSIEPDRKNQEILRSRGICVVPDVAELPDASCSYIYAINVLEHLADIEGSLGQIIVCYNQAGVYLFLFRRLIVFGHPLMMRLGTFNVSRSVL